MDKKLVLLGVLLIIASLFAVSETVQSLSTSLLNYSGGTAFVLFPGRATALNLQINKTVILTAVFISNESISYYLMNASAYNALLPMIRANESIANASSAYYGNGILEAVFNAERASFPYSTQGSVISQSAPAYYDPNATIQPGEYYAVFYGNSTRNATIVYRYTAVTASRSGVITTPLEYGSVATILLFGAGGLLLVYGIIRRRGQGAESGKIRFLPAKTKEQQTREKRKEQEEVDRLYAGIGEHRNKRGAKPRKARK